jgi:MOSC domain-containing protein YiiM
VRGRGEAGPSPLSTSGRIVAVCVGPGGIPKHPVERARVTASGLEGDRHRMRFHGGPDRAVCLLFDDEVRALVALGVPGAVPGAFGENVRIEGIDPRALASGDRLRLGDDVELELSDVREPCRTLRKLDPRFPGLMEGRSGFLARVVREGVIAPGQRVLRVARPGDSR